MFCLFTGKSAYPWSSYPLRQIWFQVRHARLMLVGCDLLVYSFSLISININNDLILTHPEQCDPLSTIPNRIEIWKCQVLLARGKTGLPGNKRPSEQRKEPVYGFALCIFCSVKPAWSPSATPCKMAYRPATFNLVWLCVCSVVQVPKLTNIKFLLTTSVHHQEKKLWELMKMITKGGSVFLVYQILSDKSLRKCVMISLGRFTWIIKGF